MSELAVNVETTKDKVEQAKQRVKTSYSGSIGVLASVFGAESSDVASFLDGIITFAVNEGVRIGEQTGVAVAEPTLPEEVVTARAQALLDERLTGNYTQDYLIAVVMQATIDASRPQPTEGEQ